MFIYSYRISLNTEVLLLEIKIILKNKKVGERKTKTNQHINIKLYVLFRTNCFPNHGNSYSNCTLE